MLDREVAAGTSPANIFVCGLSQGGALAVASVLLYPKTLGSCAVFSGSVPLRKSFAERVPPEARKTPVLWFHRMADGLVLFEAGAPDAHSSENLAWPAYSRLIQVLDTRWWIKSSSIFDNGYWSV
ncbi:hypothetical protein ACQ4PT_049998 [Festuca glaucescens]